MRFNRFEQLLAFVTVVESNSFTRAAEKLDTGKSSLSRWVSELEHRLGVQLLQRTTRRLSLTAAGEQFYSRAVQILGELDEAEHLVSETQVQPRGPVRLAAPLSFSNLHLAQVIVQFKQEYPDIELHVDLNDREIDLVEEGFDIALRIGVLRDSTLKARKLGVIRFTTCASESYLRRHGVPQHPADLIHHHGLFYSNITPQQSWEYLIDGRLQSFIPGNQLSANNGDFLAQAAVNGLGIISSPTFILNQLVKTGELTPILQDFVRPPIGLFAVLPPGRRTPVRIRHLIEYLADRFGDDPYWDSWVAPDATSPANSADELR